MRQPRSPLADRNGAYSESAARRASPTPLCCRSLSKIATVALKTPSAAWDDQGRCVCTPGDAIVEKSLVPKNGYGLTTYEPRRSSRKSGCERRTSLPRKIEAHVGGHVSHAVGEEDGVACVRGPDREVEQALACHLGHDVPELQVGGGERLRVRRDVVVGGGGALVEVGLEIARWDRGEARGRRGGGRSLGLGVGVLELTDAALEAKDHLRAPPADRGSAGVRVHRARVELAVRRPRLDEQTDPIEARRRAVARDRGQPVALLQPAEEEALDRRVVEGREAEVDLGAGAREVGEALELARERAERGRSRDDPHMGGVLFGALGVQRVEDLRDAPRAPRERGADDAERRRSGLQIAREAEGVL